jgi:hypothetical protein
MSFLSFAPYYFSASTTISSYRLSGFGGVVNLSWGVEHRKVGGFKRPCCSFSHKVSLRYKSRHERPPGSSQWRLSKTSRGIYFRPGRCLALCFFLNVGKQDLFKFKARCPRGICVFPGIPGLFISRIVGFPQIDRPTATTRPIFSRGSI